MEKIILDNDINVFGTQVKTFPMGIGEAFDKLVKMFREDLTVLFMASILGSSEVKWFI